MTEGLNRQQWRRLAVSAYLPTTLAMIGHSAVGPLLPLTARDLGSSVAEAALVIALIGVGTLVGTLPAAMVAARLGEKWALVAACLLDAVAILAAAAAPNVYVLWLLALVMGFSAAIVGLARQGYLTQAVPARFRARAMSTLGGVFRIGAFVGPLIGAALITVWGLRSAYFMAAIASVLAAAVTLGLPDLPATGRAGAAASEPVRMGAVLRRHLGIYLTVGVGAAALSLTRVARDSLLPLWADHVGLHPAETSLVFGIGAGVDMLLFYLGGSLMDRHGRRAVAVPAMVIMGVALALLPLTAAFWSVLLIAVGLGLGNGISAGVVLTLGSDNAPQVGMTQFLAGWRLTVGVGQAAGPLMITGIAAVAPLAVACLTMAGVAGAGAAWLWRWAVPQRTVGPHNLPDVEASES